MKKLPRQVIQLIQNFGECVDQIALKSIDRLYQRDIYITRIENRSGLLRDKHLKKHPHVTYLRLGSGHGISYKGLKHLKLVELDAYGSRITDREIRHMRDSLLYLDISHCEGITNKGIRKLANLQTLFMRNCPNITDDSISKLTKITELDISYNPHITDNGIKNIKLIKLAASSCYNITDEGIKEQKYLQELDITHNNNNVSNEGLKNLQLISLSIGDNQRITDEGIFRMRYTLTELDISYNITITDDVIKHMGVLRELYADRRSEITEDGIKDLKLFTFRANNNNKFSYKIVRGKKIRKLECE